MNNKKNLFFRLDWMNTSFLVLTPVAAACAFTYFIMNDLLRWPTVVLSVVMAILTGIAITGGYHRLFSHKTYDANRFVKFLYLFFGAAAFENSALRWSSDHRNHHRFVDTDKDPYNINRGFWYAHVGWVCLKNDKPVVNRFENIPDLAADPMLQWQHRNCLWLGAVSGLLLPAVVALAWGDFWGGFWIAGVMRTVINHHFTFSINSFAHLFGTQPYSDQNTARDNWFFALVTYGEGYHNFHHKFPTDYRNGVRAYQWDPTKWLVRAMEWAGWATDVRRVPAFSIVRARLKMEEKRMLRRLGSEDRAREAVTAARLRIDAAYTRFQALRAEYAHLRQQKWDSLNAAAAQKLEAIRRDMATARESVSSAVAEWGALCRQFGIKNRQGLYSTYLLS